MAWWRARAVFNRRQIMRLKRILRADMSVDEAIDLAATTYHVDAATLHRKAECESHKNPHARNPSSSSSGLFQFLPSTWATTPYARFSIWSSYANALAAGWMHSPGVNRGNEWVCR